MAFECDDTFGISFTAEAIPCDFDFTDRDTYNLGPGLNEVRKGFVFLKQHANSGVYLIEMDYTVDGNTASGPPTGITIKKATIDPIAPNFNASPTQRQNGEAQVDIQVDKDAFVAAGHSTLSITATVGLDV